jgi:uncharacterized RDD family membrane protein YckC
LLDLARRRKLQPGPDINPYAPPTELADRGLDFGAPTSSLSFGPLATRSQRFVASVLDNLFALLACAPLALVVAAWDAHEDLIPIALMFGFVLFTIFQSVIIAQSGQSLGKKLLKIKIVRPDGSVPGFVQGVVVRYWLMTMMSAVCNLVGLIDALLIFREDQRTLHDHMAGTNVIQVQ